MEGILKQNDMKPKDQYFLLIALIAVLFCLFMLVNSKL